jgi:uncharacterized Zn finger protein
MYRSLIIINLVLLALFALGCNESDDDNSVSAKLGEQFYIKVGQTESINSENIKIKLLEVTNDSRCASDVVCIWAGEVKAVLNVSINNQDKGDTTLTLGAGNTDQSIENIGGYSVKVLAVNPYPVSTHQIEQSEYIVTLIVTIDDQAG